MEQAAVAHPERRAGAGALRRQTALASGLLAALFPLLALLWRRTVASPFFALSADDFHRSLYAWEVTRGHLVPSNLWPPLQFWLAALLLQIDPRPLTVLWLLNLAAATGALVCLALLARTLGLGRAAPLAVLLAASMPWYVWLSLSGLVEPLFFLAVLLAYLGVARWQRDGSAGWLWAAALGLLAAGMLRFDAWGHALAFSLGLAWRWWRAGPARRHTWLLAAGLPWLFPLAWMAWQALAFGSPFYFARVTRSYYLGVFGPQPLLKRLLWQPGDLWALASVTLPLGLAGAWALRRRPGLPLLALMWLVSFALLVQSTLSHTISQNNPVRQVLIHAVLLAPAAAWLLARLGRRSRAGALLAGVLVVALLGARLLQLPHYPNGLPGDTEQVGIHLEQLRRQGLVRQGDGVMVEMIFWDYVILQAMTNDPGAVSFDRLPRISPKAKRGEHTLDDETNPSLLAQPSEQLRADLARRGVRLVIANSQRAAERLRPFATETFHGGRFWVFLVPAP
jgi:hypothetical protein